MSATTSNVCEMDVDVANRGSSAGNAVDGSTSQKAAVRNVQTQHGDYRSVDEENIVVLARCLSPEPDSVSEENSDGDVVAPEAGVWIEPFSDENQVSAVHCR